SRHEVGASERRYSSLKLLGPLPVPLISGLHAPAPYLVSGAKLPPKGRLSEAQGASPGNEHSNNGSPEGAMQLVPVLKRCLMTNIYLELIPNSLRRPFRAFRNLDLEPRARALGCPTGPLRGPWFRARN